MKKESPFRRLCRAIYFIFSEDDLHYGLKQPWTSIGLDANELSEGVKYAFVKGQLEFENGRLTGAVAGQVLREPGWKQESK
jgi:hypothetical protein